MIFDTCFLIDLFREVRDGAEGPATRFLRLQRDLRPLLPAPVWMEFASGFADADRERCEQFLGPFVLLPVDANLCWQASRLERILRARGQPVGDHDLWIAAAALQHRTAVVTRNRRHFEKVPGLALISY